MSPAHSGAPTRASGSIGLILEDIGNPYFSAVHRGVEDVARTRNVVTLAGSSDEDSDRERQLAATFSARRVDALIVVPGGPDHGYLRERFGGVPLVFLDRPPRFLDADAVLSDNARRRPGRGLAPDRRGAPQDRLPRWPRGH